MEGRFSIRAYDAADEKAVIDLWFECGLVVPWNNPKMDIERKVEEEPRQLLVGVVGDEIVSTCMTGYDGHRGWIYYLAVSPKHRRKGLGDLMVKHAESILEDIGCPKVELMVRKSNLDVIAFYEKAGYVDDQVVVLGKRLREDEKYEDD